LRDLSPLRWVRLARSFPTDHRWRNQYGGMKSEEARRLKDLEEENKRLKVIVAEQALDIRKLKHINSKNW